jgi:HPt (histidine-containing phosphotransfer) domain-containing protein
MAAGDSLRLHTEAGEAPGQRQPVDLQHLRRYTLGDHALEVEILGLFAEQLTLSIRALNEAACDKEWAIAAHTLKGSARAVGAWTLAAIAESAERLRPPPEGTERAILMCRLEEAAADARAYIAALGCAA